MCACARRLRRQLVPAISLAIARPCAGSARRLRRSGPPTPTCSSRARAVRAKSLVVRAIHAASVRRFHPLVAIHCGALTETLLESELFGHEKGAFTGAQYRKKGKFEIAEGGTVFLDEIGDISLKTQTDLLRVLQEREITRVGGNQVIKVDFRCVAATNKKLDLMIEEGTFRPDLYYRLNVFHIELPPLRERREDIPLLVDHFVRKFALAMNKHITRIAPSAVEQLQQQTWMGNVRELENAVERAMVVAQEPELREQDFIFKQQVIRGKLQQRKPGRSGARSYPAGAGGLWRKSEPRSRGAGYRPGHAASQTETLRMEPRRGEHQKLALTEARSHETCSPAPSR